MYPYWQRQTPEQPCYPDAEWQRPERRDQAGKLGIIGGNALGFAAVAHSYQATHHAGAGQVRVILPDALQKSVPPQMTDVLFAPTTPSGGMSSEAIAALRALDSWADGILLIGDAGKNSQTASLYESFLHDTQRPVVLTRDAVDLVQHNAAALLEKPQLLYVVSLAQLQKMFRAVYYPKLVTFHMQLAQLVETLHKFTITYPTTIVTFHAEQLIMAQGGQVITQAWATPLTIWRGTVASYIASHLLWLAHTPLAAAASGAVHVPHPTLASRLGQ